jgi:hypothetical protein
MDLAVWRDISLLWLIFLTLIALLPFGIAFYFAVRGMRRLRQLAVEYLPIAQKTARMVADKSEEISHRVAEPIIGGHTRAAQANGLLKAVFSRRKNS